jgi:predicted Na+-dependent transporter
MDRRAGVFLIFAVMCASLVPVTDDEFRWVPIVTAIVYALLALASLLDARSRKRSS